jgi:hypothetical protein
VCRAVRGVTRRRLVRTLGTLQPETIREVERALGMILGIARAGLGMPGCLRVSSRRRTHGEVRYRTTRNGVAGTRHTQDVSVSQQGGAS